MARPASRVGRGPLRWAGVVWTGRREGDFAEPWRGSPPWADVVDRPVSWLRQVHGDRVVVAAHPGEARGEEGDALVTAHPEAALAVVTADCAAVALASPEGVVAAAHAGWSGLEAGVLPRTVEAMRALGAITVEAALGPCIHAECYEFGPSDLDRLADRLGPSVRGVTAGGAPALDLPAAVGAALAEAGAELVHDENVCTACAAGTYFSHRARHERERQALVVWRG